MPAEVAFFSSCLVADRWVREEGERQERIEHREKSKAALAAGGGLWGALSAAAAGGSQGQATKNLIALIGQGSKEGEVTDAEILVELRAIEWDNLANGATVSEGGVTVAVRGGQLSAGQAYRRLLRARPEWGRGAVPELKERVASLCAKARGDAGQRWLRQLEKEARDPSKQWAWTAPSAVFGEVLSTSAGVQMPAGAGGQAGAGCAACRRHLGLVATRAALGESGRLGQLGRGAVAAAGRAGGDCQELHGRGRGILAAHAPG